MPRRRNNPWNRPEKETHTPYHNPNKGGGRGGETRGGGKSRGGGRGGEAVSNDTADSISDVLSLLMEKYSRYQNGVLDCSKLDSIEEVQKYNPNLNSAAWCKIIALTVKKLKGCKALTLDSNNVKTLYHLADALSDGVLLDSLSLQYNSIPSMEDIQKLRPLKLRHLLLRGNPLYKTDRDELLKKLKKHLPTLERIDGMEIVRSTVIDSVPLAYAGINENDPPQLTVKDFIGKYFMMSQNCSGPDKGVDQLMDFYDTKATMSFTIQPKLGLAVSGPGLTLVQRFVTSQHNVMLNPNAATVYTGKLNVGKCLESLHQAAITYDSASILRNTEITQVLPEILQSTAMPFPHLFTVVMHGKMTFSFKGKGKEVTSYNKYAASNTQQLQIDTSTAHGCSLQGTTPPSS